MTTQPFDLAAGTPEKLAELAGQRELSSSLMLQSLLVEAYDAIVLALSLDGKPFAQAFVPRVRELAAQDVHSPKEVRTGCVMTLEYVDAIRKLRVALKLPRRDLVVEYVVQAAWSMRRGPDGGGGKKTDAFERGRRLARFHNVDGSTTAATDGGRLLFFTPASQLRLRGLEVPLKPKKR